MPDPSKYGSYPNCRLLLASSNHRRPPLTQSASHHAARPRPQPHSLSTRCPTPKSHLPPPPCTHLQTNLHPHLLIYTPARTHNRAHQLPPSNPLVVIRRGRRPRRQRGCEGWELSCHRRVRAHVPHHHLAARAARRQQVRRVTAEGRREHRPRVEVLGAHHLRRVVAHVPQLDLQSVNGQWFDS